MHSASQSRVGEQMERVRTGATWSSRPSGAVAVAEMICRLLESLGCAAAVLDAWGGILRTTPSFLSEAKDLSLRDSVLACARALACGSECAEGEPATTECRIHIQGERAEVNTPTISYLMRRVHVGREMRLWLAAAPVELSVVILSIAVKDTAREQALCHRFGLTRREAEVALLLSEGFSNAEVACRLSVSKHTVRHHGERVFRKVGVRTRLALVRQLTRSARI